MNKKTVLFYVSFFILFIVLISGCTKNNPSSPSPKPTSIPTATATETGLFVEQADMIQPQNSHGVGNATAYIVLRYGNSTGAYVQGATITIGAGTLTESSAGHYTQTYANIADGASLSLSISSLAGNATSSVITPYDAEITNPSIDGNNQSAASTLEIDWRYYVVSGVIPQKVRICLWRSSDNLTVFDQTYSTIANDEYITLPVNTLPNMGQVYIRAYSINQSAIIGANGGSSTFRTLNSENTHYVNMVP
jgi:hypothetical protein